MLARNFKTAAQLRIKVAQWKALVAVLGMFERGELIHATGGPYERKNTPNGFHMDAWDCGTTHCILGWAQKLSGENFECLPGGLHELCYPAHSTCHLPLAGSVYDTINVEHAAAALRNYLSTGKPQWVEVLSV